MAVPTPPVRPSPFLVDNEIPEIDDPAWVPELPDAPDGILDLAWLSYFYDIVVFVFQSIAYFLRAIVLGSFKIVEAILDFIEEINETLGFLPPEVLLFIEISLVVMVVLRVLNR